MARPHRTKTSQLNAPQIFLLAALVGAVIALLIQFAANTPPSGDIPGLNEPRLVDAAATGA